MKVTVKLDKKKIMKRHEEAVAFSQFMVDEQVVKDSNTFAPQREGYLQASALNNSKFGSGKVVWQEPYARRLYYNPQYNFSKDKNPQAGGLWFETAKSRYKKDWVDVSKKAFKSIFGG